MSITYAWRAPVDNAALNVLHAEGFSHRLMDIDFAAQLDRHSLGWVTAHDGERLAGFVNVAWDGDVHAFVLDTVVAGDARRQGIGAALVARAVQGAREAGCEWLHVDFEDHLEEFYFDACGFRATRAGLVRL